MKEKLCTSPRDKKEEKGVKLCDEKQGVCDTREIAPCRDKPWREAREGLGA